MISVVRVVLFTLGDPHPKGCLIDLAKVFFPMDRNRSTVYSEDLGSENFTAY